MAFPEKEPSRRSEATGYDPRELQHHVKSALAMVANGECPFGPFYTFLEAYAREDAAALSAIEDAMGGGARNVKEPSEQEGIERMESVRRLRSFVRPAIVGAAYKGLPRLILGDFMCFYAHPVTRPSALRAIRQSGVRSDTLAYIDDPAEKAMLPLQPGRTIHIEVRVENILIVEAPFFGFGSMLQPRVSFEEAGGDASFLMHSADEERWSFYPNPDAKDYEPLWELNFGLTRQNWKYEISRVEPRPFRRVNGEWELVQTPATSPFS